MVIKLQDFRSARQVKRQLAEGWVGDGGYLFGRLSLRCVWNTWLGISDRHLDIWAGTRERIWVIKIWETNMLPGGYRENWNADGTSRTPGGRAPQRLLNKDREAQQRGVTLLLGD